MSASVFDSMLEKHGAAGLVHQLRLASQHRLRNRTIIVCGAIMQIQTT